MSSLIDSMDNVNYMQKQYTETENGNIAYKWNNSLGNKSIEEKIVQFYFQCVLGNEINFEEMQQKYETLLFNTKNTPYFDYVIKLAIHNRDIDEGKGMTTLSYYMLQSIYYCFYTMIEKNYIQQYYNIIKKWVEEFKYDDKTQMPYGSWKDMKKYLNILFHSNHKMFNIVNKKDMINNHIDNFYV